MKKLLMVLLSLLMVVALAACTKKEEPAPTPEPEPTPEVTVMSHADYVAAALDTEVTVETYVQAHNSWWDGKVTVYTQAEDGAYFIYDMPIEEAEVEKLVEGQKIRVTGYKSEWSGEVEITDAKYEILDGNWVAPVTDVTALLGNDEELVKHQNEKVAFNGLTVAASTDPSGNEVAWLYNWDGSGEEGSDVYFNVTDGTNTYTFLVRSYLTGPDTEVYQAAKTLNVGDVVDLEGFCYWYNGVNPHITKITVK